MIPTYEDVMKPHRKHFEAHKSHNCDRCIKYLNMKEKLRGKS